MFRVDVVWAAGLHKRQPNLLMGLDVVELERLEGVTGHFCEGNKYVLSVD
jgi:hypothetical protein